MESELHAQVAKRLKTLSKCTSTKPQTERIASTTMQPRESQGEKFSSCDKCSPYVKSQADNVTASRHVQESSICYDAEIVEMINSMIVDHGSSPKLEDIDGPKAVKDALHQMVILPAKRRDLFTGIREQTKGLLLFGPPGTETTMAMLAKAAASESEATFFHVSASSLTSELFGEGPKFVRTLFEVALFRNPSVIFFDEIDSFLSASLASENEAIRVLKGEFNIQFDWATSKSNDGVVTVIGATNKPEDLDAGVLRRLENRIYIPLSDADSRRLFFKKRLIGPEFYLPDTDIDKLVKETRAYSENELDDLCSEASMIPITELRKLGKNWRTVPKNEIRGLKYEDFQLAMRVIRPSLGQRDSEELQQWNQKFGRLYSN